MTTFLPYTVSWNLTQRCNQQCVHCYLSAFPHASQTEELTTEECFRVMEEMAGVNPDLLLILTGGEPFLRKDLFDLAGRAVQRGFTVVLGTNGSMLRQKQARLMRQHGIQGASISLDSTDPVRHDAFRQFPGSWQGAIRATEAVRAEGLPFSLHMSVTEWNAGEIPAMIDLARHLGAQVLNLFFLVRTGRGERLTDIPAAEYERILTEVARAQAAAPAVLPPWAHENSGPAESGWRELGRAPRPGSGQAGDLVIRAKCAPFFRRILYGLDPASVLLRNFSEGSCPAGRHYCRIMPNGDVTACPYMPLVAGNVRQTAMGDLWRDASIFHDLRRGRLGGRCGSCEFSRICGGCRCRAYATFGDYLAEDPACAYQPGAYGGRVIELPPHQTFGMPVEPTLVWSVEAQARLKGIPGFARGMVVASVERYARDRGMAVITPDLMQAVRERMGGRFPLFRRERGEGRTEQYRMSNTE
ncbi:MAG TPA: radical SAM protein [Candidatus Methylomirabilis sp.]|nr:radical SAM protein [Candidatus Methylomirabilis sp.]